MTLPALALVALHALTTGAGGGLELAVSAAAGAGHDSNVSHDPVTAAAVSSDLAFGSASLGVSRSGAFWTLGADVLADATELLDVPDLSQARAGAALFAAVSPWRRVTVSGTATATRSWWRDAARDAWRASPALGLRLRVLPRLALVGSLGRTWNEAEDPAYSFIEDRVAARAEVRVGAGSYLWAGYAHAWGDEVFYPRVVAAPATPLVAAATAGQGPGGPSDGGGGGGGTRRGPEGMPVTDSFPGGDRAVVRSEARTGTARAGVELALLDGLHLGLEASRVWVTADLEEYEAWVVLGVVGFRR